MTCTLKRAVKIHGARHAPGAVIDVSEDEYAFLLDQGAIDTTPPPRVNVKVRVERTPEEKAAALAEAQARVANQTAR